MTSSPPARLPTACLLVFAAAAHAADEPATLASVRERWLRGNYAEARALYETLAKDAKQRAAATVGLSKAHQSKGDYDAALRVVDEALKDDAKDAGLLARRAELLHFRG